MPRPRRQTPSGQMSLFKPAKDAVSQNSRWIATATTTVQQLVEATKRSPEDEYGQQTETQRPLHKFHCIALATYYRDTPRWIIAPFVFTSETADFTIEDGAFQDLSGTFNILDGQHRIQALHIVNDELRDSQLKADQKKLKNLMDSHISLQFIENRGPNDAAQLFVDLNKGKNISQAELASLDGRDPMSTSSRPRSPRSPGPTSAPTGPATGRRPPATASGASPGSRPSLNP